MKRKEQETPAGADRLPAEMIGLYREAVPGQRWISSRAHKVWRPPTDVYETDQYVVVKVEIAGMNREDFAISLEAKTLTIAGIRRDPANKLAYQQMEILYGEFEARVHLPWSIDEGGIEATYQDGFLSVLLPKAKPRQVPVLRAEDPS